MKHNSRFINKDILNNKYKYGDMDLLVALVNYFKQEMLKSKDIEEILVGLMFLNNILEKNELEPESLANIHIKTPTLPISDILCNIKEKCLVNIKKNEEHLLTELKDETIDFSCFYKSEVDTNNFDKIRNSFQEIKKDIINSKIDADIKKELSKDVETIIENIAIYNSKK